MKYSLEPRSGTFSDEFFRGLDSSATELTAAQTLPPLCYTDAAFFEFEKEALFNHEWLCVGRESWVTRAGDYFTTSIIGEPVVVVRNLKGELNAMSPVCQHRAMLVAEGHGNAQAFLCPYHHWCYSLDGDLVGAPAMDRTDRFDRKQIKLPHFAVEVWLGFVFINFDPDAPPLAPRLSAVSEAFANWDLARAEGPRPEQAMRYSFNWKVMFENNNDGYHANKLHHGPLHDFVPSRLATFPELPADTAGYFRFNGTTHPDASFNATQKAILPIFPQLTEVDRGRMVFANVPPTLSLVFTCDAVIYLILRADAAESHEMDVGLLFAPDAMKEPSHQHRLAVLLQAAQVIMAQDQHVDELVQKGLRSRFAIRGRYSWQEGAQRQLNGWLVPRYQQCWTRLRKNAPV
jgi:phenylpropionate dioxygenase-like ring-hydroxylating dioxygenase large terminal subunit